MRVCVHCGAEEIGGNCIEIEAGAGERLLLDLGRPLDARPDGIVPLPPVAGLASGDDPTLLGVVISHPHQDHWGLVPQIAPTVPVYMGEAAARLLREAAFFSRAGADLHPAGFLRDRQPLRLGPFTITPYLMDHSAFDAYALLVEADGQRLFYTGDLRAHGRKGRLFDRLVSEPPRDVDVLLLEGTNIRPSGERPVSATTERDVERRCIQRFKDTAGLALVANSAQNIDRLVTLYRAALQADRDFVMDLYTATMARATGRSSIPCPGPKWPRVRVFVPHRQRVAVLESREFERVEWIRGCRIYREELAARAGHLVMEASATRDMGIAGCLDGASLTWSLWSGYLHEERGIGGWARRRGLPVEVIHASGHAYAADLQRLAAAVGARRTIRIHTLAPPTDGVRNGEWWRAA